MTDEAKNEKPGLTMDDKITAVLRFSESINRELERVVRQQDLRITILEEYIKVIVNSVDMKVKWEDVVAETAKRHEA